MKPTLTNPTGRKTEARIFTDALGNQYFFSYETCIAYRGRAYDPMLPDVAVRIANTWGPTTGRHFNELGCAGFDEVSDYMFDWYIGNRPIHTLDRIGSMMKRA